MATFSYFPTPTFPPLHPFTPPPPPPPPFHPIAPPPPHVLPPPPPSPDNGPTIVIVVFISVGGFFFAFFCFFFFFCLIKKRREKVVNETDIIRRDEHVKVKEAIVEGPNGAEVVVLSIEDELHVQEDIIKNEKMVKAKSTNIAADDRSSS